MPGQSIAAAAEIAPRDGLAGALGYGVIVPDSDPLDPAGKWLGPSGYTLEGEPCPDPEAIRVSLDFCEPAQTWSADDARALVSVVADQHPFGVVTAVKCSALGAGPELIGRFEEAARRALDLAMWPQIANELWTGSRSIASGWSNRRLASPEATVLSSDPVSLVEAIGALEDAFGACSTGDVQLIHVPRKLSAYLDAANIVSTTPGSGRIWTANNSLVVADRGYPGTGPNDEEPGDGTCWIYSTGVLSARLGAVRIPEQDLAAIVNAETNDAALRAMRPAAIGWLCCHLAIAVRYAEASETIGST